MCLEKPVFYGMFYCYSIKVYTYQWNGKIISLVLSKWINADIIWFHHIAHTAMDILIEIQVGIYNWRQNGYQMNLYFHLDWGVLVMLFWMCVKRSVSHQMTPTPSIPQQVYRSLQVTPKYPPLQSPSTPYLPSMPAKSQVVAIILCKITAHIFHLLRVFLLKLA